MKVALQRIKSAHVALDDHLIASSKQGLLAFVVIEHGDTEKDEDSMIQRILQTALWPEENEPQSEWKKSIQEKEGDILCIPEFTFHGQQEDWATPNPDISDLEKAQHRYKSFMKKLSNTYRAELVKNDVFEAMMAAPLNGDAPIGISYESTDSVVTIKIVTQTVNENMARKTDGKCSGINLPASLQK